jgi:hypothetical protein
VWLGLEAAPIAAIVSAKCPTQPSLDEFQAQYPAFLAKHQQARGQLLQVGHKWY